MSRIYLNRLDLSLQIGWITAIMLITLYRNLAASNPDDCDHSIYTGINFNDPNLKTSLLWILSPGTTRIREDSKVFG